MLMGAVDVSWSIGGEYRVVGVCYSHLSLSPIPNRDPALTLRPKGSSDLRRARIKGPVIPNTLRRIIDPEGRGFLMMWKIPFKEKVD